MYVMIAAKVEPIDGSAMAAAIHQGYGEDFILAYVSSEDARRLARRDPARNGDHRVKGGCVNEYDLYRRFGRWLGWQAGTGLAYALAVAARFSPRLRRRLIRWALEEEDGGAQAPPTT